jgi:hypothetical protein
MAGKVEYLNRLYRNEDNKKICTFVDEIFNSFERYDFSDVPMRGYTGPI